MRSMLKLIKESISLLCLGLFFIIPAHAANLEALLRQPQDPVAGNPKGKVTIVEFFDYQCGYCKNMAPVISSIIKSNPNVRIVFKEFPILGSLSDLAARAALAANQQGKYYIFNHALLTTSEPLTTNYIYQLASQLGLNIRKLKNDMHSSNVDKALRNNHRLGQELNVRGTPSFFIAKTTAKNFQEVNVEGRALSNPELQQAIDETAKK